MADPGKIISLGWEQEQQVYQEFLTREIPWVMVIRGLAGTGKSELLHDMAIQTPASKCITSLSFAHMALQRDVISVFSEIAQQIKHYCEAEQFKIFKETIQQARLQLMNSSLILVKKVAPDSLSLDREAHHELRRQIQEQVKKAFYNLIDTFTPDQLIIMIDNCEWLNESESLEVGESIMEGLIPVLHARMQHKQKRCSFVIATSGPLELKALDELDVIDLMLSPLDEKVVDQFLIQVGIQDSALRQSIYKLTHGHPGYLSLIRFLIEEPEKPTREPLTMADFPKIRTQFLNDALSDIWSNLNELKSPFRELISYGALLRRFDLPLLQAVFPELVPKPEARYLFNQLIRYPFVESRGIFYYGVSDLLCEPLSEHIRMQEPERWRVFHARALDYLNRVSPNSDERYYHEQALQEVEASDENFMSAASAFAPHEIPASKRERAAAYYNQGQEYYKNAKMAAALESYDLALALFNEFGSSLEQANVLQAIGDVLQYRKEADAALQKYEQALVLYRKNGKSAEQAHILRALGDILQYLNESDAALQRYEQAHTFYQEAGNHLGEADVQLAIGNVLLFRRDLQAALQRYEQARTLYHQIGNNLAETEVQQIINRVLLSSKDNAVSSMHLVSDSKTIEIFVVYSRSQKDENLRKELEKQLILLKRRSKVITWYDRVVSSGEEWTQEIETHLNRASIILFLVSTDFMASDYVDGIEMKRAMEKHEIAECRVIPIILRPVAWETAPFSKLQPLPTNGKPVSRWADRDSAFLDIFKGIQKVIKGLMISM